MSFSTIQRAAQSAFIGLCVSLACASSALAQTVFNGPGLQGGVKEAGTISGPVHSSLREVVLTLLRRVLDYLALAAVVVIVGAGVYLVVGGGSEDSKNKAKTIILYTIIGLLVVLLARAVVGFVMYGIF